jgi:hypothetical protein
MIPRLITSLMIMQLVSRLIKVSILKESLKKDVVGWGSVVVGDGLDKHPVAPGHTYFTLRRVF